MDLHVGGVPPAVHQVRVADMDAAGRACIARHRQIDQLDAVTLFWFVRARSVVKGRSVEGSLDEHETVVGTSKLDRWNSMHVEALAGDPRGIRRWNHLDAICVQTTKYTVYTSLHRSTAVLFQFPQRRHLGGGGAGGRRPQGKRKKEKKEIKKKKEKNKRKNEKKREKRKKGTMNNVKLLHIKCCFFPIFQ